MFAALAATDDGALYFLVLPVVLAALGWGLASLTVRMQSLKQRISYWAAGLGIASGVIVALSYFASTEKSAENLLYAIFMGAMLGVSATCTWLFVVSILTFFYQYVLAPPFRVVGWVWQRWSARRARKREERRRRAEQRAYERGAPDRARIAASQASAQKRRDDARARSELLFALHAPTIGERFPRAMFDSFVGRYMGDSHAPETVEEREEQLREIILQHAHQIAPPKTPYTIESLATWYKQTKDMIEHLPVDARSKQAQVAQLNARYAELMQDLMEKLHP